MPENVRYFKLSEDVGIEPEYLADPKTGEPVKNPKAGEQQPLKAWGFPVAVPTIIKIAGRDELVLDHQRIDLPDPRYGVICPADNRVWQIHDPVVAGAMANGIASGDLPMTEIDKPKAVKAGKE